MVSGRSEALRSASMPHYVIHIGPHKTGSTYLQVLFQRLSAQLCERGILYPLDLVGEHAPGHSLLVERLRDAKDTGLARRFQEWNASSYSIILISSEDISKLPAGEIERLRSYLGGHRATIIFHCRRWLELLPSSWQEIVKHGQTTTFPEFMATNLMNPFASPIINYATLLDRFEPAFGIDNMVLVSYSNIVEQGGDLGEHFFRNFLGWPDAPLIPGLRPNPSLSISDIEVIRTLNAFAWKRSGCPTDRLRVRYLRAKPTLDLSVPFAAMDNHRGLLRLNENSRALHAVHEEIFAKYGRRLVAPRSARYFFVQRQGGIEYVKQDYLWADGVLGALNAIYDQIRD